MASLSQLMRVGGRVPLSQYVAQQGSGGPAPGGAAPQFADVWKYLYPGAPQGSFSNAGNSGGGEGGGTGGGDPSGWQPGQYTPDPNTPAKYQGMVTGYNTNGALPPGVTPEMAAGVPIFGAETADSGPSAVSQFTYDTAKMKNELPTTKFGDFASTGITSLGSGAQPDWGMVGDMHIMNKNAAYDDPNYGWITPSKNVSQENRHFADTWADTIMPAIASMAMGSAGMPALAGAAVGGAKTFGDTGNWQSALMNILPGLIGAGMGAGGFELPPGLADALKYGRAGLGLYGAVRNRNPVAGGMTLARLAGFGG